MKKKGKFGVNSGNSLSFGHSIKSMNRNKKYQNEIIKVVKINSSKIESLDKKSKCLLDSKVRQALNDNDSNLNDIVLAIDDNIIDSDGDLTLVTKQPSWIRPKPPVSYSLNKKSRWLLKDQLIDSINHLHAVDQKEDQKSFKLTLTERKIKTKSWMQNNINHCGKFMRNAWGLQNDCVAYHTSAGTNQLHSKPKQKKYSYEVDLKEKTYKTGVKNHKNRRKAFHNQHFRGVQREYGNGHRNNRIIDDLEKEEEAQEDLCPEIHYEICTPQEVSGHGSYNIRTSRSYADRFNNVKAKKKHKSNRERHFPYTQDEWEEVKEREGKSAYNHVLGCSVYYENDFLNDTETFEEFQNFDDNNYSNCKDCESQVDSDNNCRGCEKYFDNYTYVLKDSDSRMSVSLDDLLNVKKQTKKSRKTTNSFSNEKLISKIIYEETANTYSAESNNVVNCKQDNNNFLVFQDIKHEPIIEKESPKSNNSSINTQITKLPPTFQIMLQLNGILPQALRNSYSENYEEASSYPRCFMINLSKNYRRTSSENGSIFAVFRMVNSDTVFIGTSMRDHVIRDTYLFEVQITGDMNAEHMAQIQINVSDTMNRNSTTVYSIHDAIERIFTSVKVMLHVDENESASKSINDHNTGSGKLDLKKSKVKANSLFKDIAQQNQWRVRVHDFDTALKISDEEQALIQIKENHYIPETPTESDYECGICFKTASDFHSDISNGDFVALTYCKHYFCNTCWREHIVQCINNGAETILCPEYECDIEIDKVTAISIVGFPLYRKHVTFSQNLKIEKNPSMKWCPKKGCSKIVEAKPKYLQKDMTISKSDNICVECVCKKRWCFSCQNEPHWPLPCSKLKKYTKKVGIILMDNQEVIESVRVKKCPNCHYPIEKSHGCPSMICKCGTNFCWTCGKFMAYHDWDMCNMRAGYEFVTIYLQDHVDNEWFINQAIRFRKLRMETNLKKLSLRGRIQKLLINHRKMCTIRKQNNVIVTYKQISNEVDEIMEALQVTCQLIYQVYHVLEYSYAVLSNFKSKVYNHVLNELFQLELLVTRFTKVLYSINFNSSNDLLHKVSETEETIKNQLKMLSKKINKVLGNFLAP